VSPYAKAPAPGFRRGDKMLRFRVKPGITD
jgi:hypothetical protein